MNLKLIAALAAGLVSAPAFSAGLTLDFEGAPSFASVGNFYSDVGVLFGGDAQAIANDVLGPYYSNAPSPVAVMAPVGLDAALNVAVGFAGQASFYYSSLEATSVSIFSGLNGTGSVLGTFSLLANATNGCTATPFCHWDLASVTFDGVAQSIQFGSAANIAGFDNINVAPVPVPAAVWLLLSGIGGLGAIARRKR